LFASLLTFFILLLLLQDPKIPPNEQCKEAIEVGNTPFSNNGDVSSIAGFDVDTCGVTALATGVWFQYIPTGSFDQILTTVEAKATEPYSFRTPITLFTGSCDQLNCLLPTQDNLFEYSINEHTYINYIAEAGETYHILLTGGMIANTEIPKYNLTVTVSFQEKDLENQDKQRLENPRFVTNPAPSSTFLFIAT
jgi:hypothetical protein